MGSSETRQGNKRPVGHSYSEHFIYSSLICGGLCGAACVGGVSPSFLLLL